MDIVIHRVNSIQQLREIPTHRGVEIDIRADGSTLILNHDPFKGGERFAHYLEHYQHGLLVLNIKEAGIEAEVLRLVREKGLKEYFLLDVEFPYIYRASRLGERCIAMRYSEDESIETVLKYRGKVDWIWIDTNTELPLDQEIILRIKSFRTCLVCPERWARPQDIPIYQRKMQSIGFSPDAVMTTQKYASCWEASVTLPNARKNP